MAPMSKITVDHVVPVSLGGSNDPANLVAACSDCNSGKSSTPLDGVVLEDVGRRAREWSSVRDEVLSEWRSEDDDQRIATAEFLAYWKSFTLDDGSLIPCDPGWRKTVAHWLKAGFSVDDLCVMVDKMMARSLPARDRWRYFCGIVWRTLDEIDNRVAEKAAQAPKPQPEPPQERVWIASANHVFPHPASRYVDPEDYDPRRDRGYDFDDSAMWSH